MVLAFAAAAPFTGVPPRGVSASTSAPGTVALDTQPLGELTLDPAGQLLAPTPLPPPGEGRGVTAKLKLTNIAPLPVRVAVRLVPVEAELGDAVTIRASVAKTVVFDGPLRSSEQWSEPTSGVIDPGKSSTLRIRLQLRPGVRPEDWLGREDVRRIELTVSAAPQTPPDPTTPGADPTTLGAGATIPAPSSPATPPQ